MNLFHKFHLDDGNTSFDSSPQVQEAQLKSYKASSFLRVVPTLQAQELMRGQKIFLIATNSGFELFVAAKLTAPSSSEYTTARGINSDLTLNFLIYIVDPLFENYSNVSAVQDIPFYFSNSEPAAHAGTFNYIDVTTAKPISDFQISQTEFETISKDFTPKELQGLFGIIGLKMQGDNTVPVDGDARDLIDSNGVLVDPPPVFKIQFGNRHTIWNYKSAANGTLIHSSDPTTLPLVKRGIVGYSFDSEDRPAAQPDRLVFETDNNGTIIKTFSEIYI